jgi:hypothetical protein
MFVEGSAEDETLLLCLALLFYGLKRRAPSSLLYVSYTVLRAKTPTLMMTDTFGTKGPTTVRSTKIPTDPQ